MDSTIEKLRQLKEVMMERYVNYTDFPKNANGNERVIRIIQAEVVLEIVKELDGEIARLENSANG